MDDWRRAIDALEKLASLVPDWDGNGAVAPPFAIVAKAVGLAETFARAGLPTPNRISPAPCGEVIFEWESHGIYLEVEVTSPDAIEWMRVGLAGPAMHGDSIDTVPWLDPPAP